MAKLVFPTVQAPYRGFVGEMRGWFNRIASYSEKQPGSLAVLRTQLNALAQKIGYTSPIPPNQAIVTDEDIVPANDDYVVTLSVTDGAVTAVVTGGPE